MLKQEELKYLESKIRETIINIGHHHFQFIMSLQYEEEEEFPGWTEEWLKVRLEDLYYLILTFLEGKEMPHLLDAFKNKFQKKFNDRSDLLKAEITHPDGEPELLLITDFWRFLEPFKNFNSQQLKEDEQKKVISILKNTGFILKNTKTEIKNEASVYNQVKWVLGLYYPTCRKLNKASFIEEFKSYHPDILIPELKVAIEYKYIKNSNDNIDDYIDQIRIDASNYKGDLRYETFYAVIYIEDISIATPESIEVAWKSKHFPNNWELIISGNSSLIKSS